jgi:hypothetical protein
MKWKALQPYYKVQREVTSGEQKTVVSNREMYLYENKIVTRHREFPIHTVFDMSFRKIGSEGGLLYLHTSSGVYPYTVKDDPNPFIEVFKESKDLNG